MNTLRQMTTNEAAKVLGVTRRTIERRIQKGDIVASCVKTYTAQQLVRLLGTQCGRPTVEDGPTFLPS